MIPLPFDPNYPFGSYLPLIVSHVNLPERVQPSGSQKVRAHCTAQTIISYDLLLLERWVNNASVSMDSAVLNSLSAAIAIARLKNP